MEISAFLWVSDSGDQLGFWVSRSIDVFLWVFDGGDQCGFLNRQVVVWVSGLVVVCVGFGGWHGLLWLWWWLLAGGRWFARM